MISDLDENEHDEDSELAVEKLGLKDINDLGPPELPQAIDVGAEMIRQSPTGCMCAETPTLAECVCSVFWVNFQNIGHNGRPRRQKVP